MAHATMLMRPDEYRVMFEIEDTYWWYRGVRVLLTEWLTRVAPPDPSRARLLDVGCGTGANLERLQAYGTAVGVDLSPRAIAFCHARGLPPDRAFLASATALPFAGSTFDLAISFDVICNIPDDARAFAEIARVLTPGGWLIVGLPACPWLWSAHDVAVGHQRRYDAADVRAKLVAAGFEVERLTHANTLLLPPIALLRLTARRAPAENGAVRSDLVPLPRVVNAPLGALFAAEMRLAARRDLPAGLSVMAMARKR
jgi:SAM-dependent methyltransferase